jgi:isopentenyl diphosphate isomerase/L-lactate dehydrogenase-like FMN-dependent dehydrogenase
MEVDLWIREFQPSVVSYHFAIFLHLTNKYRVQPAIVTLLEIHKECPEIFGQLEIYVDGGIRRGTDILKALALGATAVGVGRPYLYSLAYGQEGVQHLTESTFIQKSN